VERKEKEMNHARSSSKKNRSIKSKFKKFENYKKIREESVILR